jgi:hypothetical protein
MAQTHRPAALALALQRSVPDDGDEHSTRNPMSDFRLEHLHVDQNRSPIPTPIFDSERAEAGGFAGQVIELVEVGLVAVKGRAAK